MYYRTLYREWRPQDFNEMVGQEHVCRILKNALSSGRVSHAYLFSGPRGTGKTSTAKILAKGLNCACGPTPEPCNQCSACKRITAGEFLDVLEIDGASNRGIDEVRELREKVQLAPVEGRNKVYIIDEVHMLTTEAFNALLKTLEDPPDHVVFIFATTEAHKIPLTVLSRCQQLEFHRLPVAAIVERLQEVAVQEEVEIEPKTLFLLAKKAEGSLRDALGLLDQCIAFAEKEIGHEEVIDILGVSAGENLEAIGGALAEKNVAALLKILNELLDRGRDPRQLVKDLINYFRNLLVVKVCTDPGDLVAVTADEGQVLNKQAQYFTPEQLLTIIELLAHTESEVRWSAQPRILLEVLAVRLVQKLAAGDLIDIAIPNKQEIVARDSTDRVVPVKVNQSKNIAPVDIKAPQTREPKPVVSVEKKEAVAPAAAAISLVEVKKRWPEVLEKVKEVMLPAVSIVREGEPVKIQQGRLTLAFSHEVYKDRVVEKYKDLLENIFKSVFAEDLALHCVLIEDGATETREYSLLQEVIEVFGSDLVVEKKGTPKQ